MQNLAHCVRRYGLWMKGPHNFMVIALGLCVKWPLGPLINGLGPPEHWSNSFVNEP